MNYREYSKKWECLLSAIIWTAIPVVDLFLSFYTNSINSQLDLKSTWFAILSLVLEVAAAFHWYRYLAYDKKVVKDE